jgi:hypothetical protein
MQTTNFFIPRQSLYFGKGKVEQDRRNGRQRATVRIPDKTEPESRLWKVSMETASLKASRLELIAFLLSGFLVCAAAVYCGSELLYVVNSDALEQTVQALLSSSSAAVTDLVH